MKITNMKFDIQENQEKNQEQSTFNIPIPKLKVIGIGGGGSNTVNYIAKQSLEDVELLVANTDAVHLKTCFTPKKIFLGKDGLGTGADIEQGKATALDSEDKIKEAIDGANLLFITAGMGGGTGTGAAPEVAKMARDMGILTIGVVTTPFIYENRTANATEGLNRLEPNLDCLITIPNQKVFELIDKFSMQNAFGYVDNVLYTAIKGISEVITKSSYINCDFNDLKAVLQYHGRCIIGIGESNSENAVIEAIENACNHPLLQDYHLEAAHGLVVKVTTAATANFDIIQQVGEYIQSKISNSTNIFYALDLQENLESSYVAITVIATGLQVGQSDFKMMQSRKNYYEQARVNSTATDFKLHSTSVEESLISNKNHTNPNKFLQEEESFDTPPALRKQVD